MVDILSLDTMTWRPGKKPKIYFCAQIIFVGFPGTRLPIGLWSPEAVTFRNDDGRVTFLLMGGEASV